MTFPKDENGISVRLAKNSKEIEAAQHLRYKVFYEEFGAKPTPEMEALKRDFDSYDNYTDHLIVLDPSLGDDETAIVGTYRLLRKEQADKAGHFYTFDEYDITPLLNSGMELLELGRSCVLPPYRTRPVLQKLWEGIAQYLWDHKIDLMFGCASLHGTDPAEFSQELAYMHHYHLAPENLRPKAHEKVYTNMNLHEKEDINAKKAFMGLPPLIKGYLRLGAMIGDGAYIDYQFNTTDVCIVLPTEKVTGRYVKHYERKTQRPSD